MKNIALCDHKSFFNGGRDVKKNFSKQTGILKKTPSFLEQEVGQKKNVKEVKRADFQMIYHLEGKGKKKCPWEQLSQYKKCRYSWPNSCLAHLCTVPLSATPPPAPMLRSAHLHN